MAKRISNRERVEAQANRFYARKPTQHVPVIDPGAVPSEVLAACAALGNLIAAAELRRRMILENSWL